MNTLPTHIFFTGVPGSRWSGIAQTLELLAGINTSDHSESRRYSHAGFGGHSGVYFGEGMEFPASLTTLDTSAWQKRGGCKIVKSHDWAYNLNSIKQMYSNVWIMLVYRPDKASFDWWKEAGGFDIAYPSYAWYENDEKMMAEIKKQNECILEFAEKHKANWAQFDSLWIRENFDQFVSIEKVWSDITVALIK
jgi:hypothetical protein